MSSYKHVKMIRKSKKIPIRLYLSYGDNKLGARLDIDCERITKNKYRRQHFKKMADLR
jgi:hypothetical protein